MTTKTDYVITTRTINKGAVLQQRVFEDFRGGLCKEPIIGQEPVPIVHYIRPESSIKWPTSNYEATLRPL